ncbi:hypothetical protein N7462_004488 [Penicillium macrosclerotiorum]|uniref:uncharacterized protein n=1 Tax=Penicillium macrosclerotiorum TaxID=303699 RepID=UPI0025495AD4|nr:uncharacterized protein N7462_004488 [Penicillium macrosclerotiorum]KAJ5690096.1 hypothetical protein N7462_004488 [Penicillium macrosclerotiorum]
MVSFTMFLLPLYLACLPSTTAWVFSWTNSSGNFLTDHGETNTSCKTIDNPEGNIFDWDPKGGNFCFYIYNNKNCTDPSAGYTCKPWPWSNHQAGSYMRSYIIVNNNTEADSTTTSSTAVSSTMTTSTTSSIATATPTSASETTSTAAATNSSNSISGGAIAGIIVGVLAAAAIAGILLFFLWWRPRRRTGLTSIPDERPPTMSELSTVHEPKQSSPSEAFSSEAFTNETFSQTSDQPIYSPQRLRELPGSTGVSELGSGNMRAELDGSTHWKN